MIYLLIIGHSGNDKHTVDSIQLSYIFKKFDYLDVLAPLGFTYQIITDTLVRKRLERSKFFKVFHKD